jgi:hypothetical protein
MERRAVEVSGVSATAINKRFISDRIVWNGDLGDV